MGDTTKRYRIYHYSNVKGYQLIDEINVRNVYDSRFYHRPMPTIGERKCKEILKKMFPCIKADGVLVQIEDVETGYKHIQELYRNGTIING